MRSILAFLVIMSGLVASAALAQQAGGPVGTPDPAFAEKARSQGHVRRQSEALWRTLTTLRGARERFIKQDSELRDMAKRIAELEAALETRLREKYAEIGELEAQRDRQQAALETAQREHEALHGSTGEGTGAKIR